GYGGDITFSVGITNEGVINGYSITAISETAGLGMKATEDKFSSQFRGIPVGTYEVTKASAGENEIEAISGATITSRAMTYGVDAAVSYFEFITGGAK
ncbi:MAG: FMN-binding protein, partial [Lachnospiraceae bacterium]|nr:FMN-binding protein [Lachnospiraceae bacterium]